MTSTVFLTPNETAKILRTSVRTLERTRLEGTGPRFVKFGRRVLYRPEDVAIWADEHAVRSTAEHEQKIA